MPTVETIHFVAGLGQAEGKNLAASELLAIHLAAKFHPQASLFLHTANVAGTCDNYKQVPSLRRVTYAKDFYSATQHWQIEQGQHMSDLLRLHVLLSCRSSNALYLDTDAYCTRSLDYLASIEGCAMARLGPFMVANGLIYAGQDRSFLQHWLSRILEAGPPKSVVDYSCRMPHELAMQVPGLTVLDCEQYHGYSGDQAMQNAWCSVVGKDFAKSEARRLIQVSPVVHTMSPRPKPEWQSGTVYEAVLQELQSSVLCR